MDEAPTYPPTSFESPPTSSEIPLPSSETPPPSSEIPPISSEILQTHEVGAYGTAAGSDVPQYGKKRITKAMVAIDDSEISLYALRWTVDHLFDGGGPPETLVSGDGGNGTIVVLHVVEPYSNPLYAADSLNVPPSEVTKAVDISNKGSSTRLLARAMEICSGTTALVETMVVEGKPKETICEIAEKIHPDLVIVGRRGLGQIKRVFVGSVSDYCTQNLHCPVLVVKSPN